jgi:DNA-directed RNA polymerase specialized sigma24 family protein
MTMNDSNQIDSPRTFATTHWSVVLVAGHKSSPDADVALATLCETYWFPLYAYVRRRGHNVNEAQNLTQEFFARVLEKDYVAAAAPERGRVRAILLTAFKHFLSKERDKKKSRAVAWVSFTRDDRSA